MRQTLPGPTLVETISAVGPGPTWVGILGSCARMTSCVPQDREAACLGAFDVVLCVTVHVGCLVVNHGHLGGGHCLGSMGRMGYRDRDEHGAYLSVPSPHSEGCSACSARSTPSSLGTLISARTWAPPVSEGILQRQAVAVGQSLSDGTCRVAPMVWVSRD